MTLIHGSLQKLAVIACIGFASCTNQAEDMQDLYLQAYTLQETLETSNTIQAWCLTSNHETNHYTIWHELQSNKIADLLSLKTNWDQKGFEIAQETDQGYAYQLVQEKLRSDLNERIENNLNTLQELHQQNSKSLCRSWDQTFSKDSTSAQELSEKLNYFQTNQAAIEDMIDNRKNW